MIDKKIGGGGWVINGRRYEIKWFFSLYSLGGVVQKDGVHVLAKVG